VEVAGASRTGPRAAAPPAPLGKLDQVCAQLPDPQLLIRPALYREALDTSALEGTVGILRDLLEAQLPSTHYMSREITEINAYVAVATNAFQMIKTRPISIAFLSELQARLFRDAEDKPSVIGMPRQDIVWIGNKERPIEEARFVPPPPDDRLRSGLDAWQSWVQSEDSDLAPVVRAAMAHYQFETLHPFGDGNGRLGRLIVVLQLLGCGAVREPAITLSPWLLRNRTEYQQGLLEVSCTGNWNPWIQFFCRAVQAQCTSLIAGAQRLLNWLAESRRTIDGRRWTGAIQKMLADLIEEPVTTVTATALRYAVSQVNATRMINHLSEVGILTEVTGRTYGRIYAATEVMKIVDEI
jgi:Fic family protein